MSSRSHILFDAWMMIKNNHTSSSQQQRECVVCFVGFGRVSGSAAHHLISRGSAIYVPVVYKFSYIDLAYNLCQ